MSYDVDIGRRILELMSEAGLGLHGACLRLGVPRSVVRRWVATHPEFARELAEARRQSYEVWADQIIEIAAAAAEPGKTIAEVNAARLKVDSRKWLLGKLNPQQYGDSVEVTGKDGKDLLPLGSEAQVPKMLAILAVLLPGANNIELLTLATSMVRKLEGPPAVNGAADPQGNGDGSRDD